MCTFRRAHRRCRFVLIKSLPPKHDLTVAGTGCTPPYIQYSVDELERVAASYLLRPRGSMCLASGTAVDDEGDDDRFADDGSVYIYREGDSSPSAEDPPRGCGNTHEEDAEHGGGDDSGRFGGKFFSPRGMDEGDMEPHENDCRLWQDERRVEPSPARTQEVGPSSSGHDWDVSGGDDHRGVSLEHAETGSTPVQHGGGGGDVAAGVNSKDGRQGNKDIKTWRQQQEQQRAIGPSGGADLAERKYTRSGGGAQQAQPGAGRAPVPLAATLEARGERKNDRGFILPDRGFSDETTPVEALTVPVPGASYSAKTDRGVQGQGGWDTTSTRGLGGDDDAGASTQPSPKVRQAAARLRSMVLERQASANRSIREVFGHFDRRRCGYVNVAEMRDPLADLRLNLSPEEGKVSLKHKAMNPAQRRHTACSVP